MSHRSPQTMRRQHAVVHRKHCTRHLVTHARALHCSGLSHMIRRPSGLYCDMRTTQRKNDNFTKGNHSEHRKPWTSSPQGEPGSPPGVLTPQSSCTTTRAVGVGTLYQDTIYAAAARTNVTPALLHRTGGVINPVGPEAHPCAGAPPPSTEPC